MFKQAGLRSPNGVKKQITNVLASSRPRGFESCKWRHLKKYESCFFLSLEHNTINEEEFFLLSEEFESKNPENQRKCPCSFKLVLSSHFCPNLYA